MSLRLTVENVGKEFVVGRPSVSDVSMVVAAGEVAVLLGPSGCGKTTMLRMVGGLETPTSGQIRLGERVLSNAQAGVFVPPQRRNLAMVFQSYAIWPHLTVGGNVAYPLRRRGTPRAARDQAVREALDLVGLAGFEDRTATTLSGGQMQRVALARSMAYRPDLLLLDEPMSNLDPELRVRLREDLRRIIRRSEVTALYVTHDQTEAAALGDTIGVMRSGRMQQFTSTAALFAKPSSPNVARFLGASNIFKGVVATRRDDIVDVSCGPFRVAATAIGDLREGAAVEVLFRPEGGRLAEPEPHCGSTPLQGKVRDLEFLGSQTRTIITTASGDFEILEFGTRRRWSTGQTVSVDLDPAATWAYPAEGVGDGGPGNPGPV